MRRRHVYRLVRDTKTKFLNISTSIILVAMTLGGTLPALLLHQAYAAASVTSTPSDTQGWGAQDGTPIYVPGPSGADGYGSLELTTVGQPKQNYFHSANTSLSGISGLGYKVDVATGVPASYQLQVIGATQSGNSQNTVFTSLVWEPAYNGQANGPNGGFVTESNLENGVWWSSHPIAGAPNRNTFVPLSTIIAANPGATIVAYGVNVGTGTPDATSFVDDVSFQSQVTNFETNPPVAPTDLYFTRNGSANPIACGSVVNTSAGMTLHWAAPGSDLYQYAITPSYPDNHGQYTYYPGGSATSVWIGDNFGHHGDGVYTYVMKAQNVAKQWSDTVTCSLTYDSTAPVVSVRPDAGSILSGNVTFTITVKDANLDTSSHATWVYLYGNGNGTQDHPDWHATTGAKVDLSSGTGTFSVNTKDLPDGTYNLDVGKLYDAAGNPSSVGDSYFDNYVIDNTVPTTPTLLSPVDRGYTKTNDFYFDWTDSVDANPGVTYEFQSSQNPHTTNGVLDTGVWDNLTNGNSEQKNLTDSKIHSTGAPDGTWYWQVRAIDAAGNKSAWTPVWHVTIDTHGPATTLNIENLVNGYVNSRQHGNLLTITGNAGDNLGLNRVLVQLLTSKHGAIQNNLVYLSGTSQSWSTDFNVKQLGLADGTYSVVATVVDDAGNTYKTAYLDFTLDNTKPVATFTSATDNPTPNGYYRNNFTVSYDVSDNFKLAAVDVSLFDTDVSHSNHWAAGCYSNSGETGSDDSGSCVVHLGNLPDGRYYVAVQGKDAAGLYTVAATRYITIDRTAPAVPQNAHFVQNGSDLGSDAATNHTGSNLWFVWDASSAVSGIQSYEVIGTTPDGHSLDFTISDPSQLHRDLTDLFTFYGEGVYMFQVRAISQVGLASAYSATGTIIYDRTRPTIVFTNPTDFSKPFKVGPMLTIEVSDPDGSGVDSSQAVLHVYNAADNSQTSAWCNDATSCDTSGLADGDYYVKAGINDKAGNNQTVTQAFTIDSTAPVVAINGYGTKGNVIQPNVTVSDASTSLTYAWTPTNPNITISDPTAMNPTFTVNTDGTYTFTLTVTDAAGNSNAASFTFSYATPVQTLTPPVNPTPAFTAVLGTTSTNNGATTPLTDNGTGTDTPQVKGASTTTSNSPDNTVKIENAASTQHNNFLGLGWWWLLILAAILGFFWFAIMRRADSNKRA